MPISFESSRNCYYALCFSIVCLSLVISIGLILSSGRRGVFGGVVEGLHQHWKHREVVKVITMQRLFGQVIYTAKSLVAETGGILVSVDKIKEGHAIIIYRGKNYRRPLKLRTENLLTKRKALLRSLEMQRLGVSILKTSVSCIIGIHLPVYLSSLIDLCLIHFSSFSLFVVLFVLRWGVGALLF